MTTTPTSPPSADSTPLPMAPPPVTLRKRFRPQWQRQIRYVYLRFLRLQGTPEQLARGMAAGVFAGCFPLFGFQTILGMAVATAVGGNRLMAAAATWVSNPLTYVPLFAFNYQVGNWLLGGSIAPAFADLDTVTSWMDMGSEVSVRLLLGSTVIGVIAAAISYVGGLPLVRRVRSRQTTRQQRQLEVR